MNRIIQRDMGFSTLEFVWQDTREQDPREAAQIDVAYVGAGILTVDEVRQKMGLKRVGSSQLPVGSEEKKQATHHEPRTTYHEI